MQQQAARQAVRGGYVRAVTLIGASALLSALALVSLLPEEGFDNLTEQVEESLAMVVNLVEDLT